MKYRLLLFLLLWHGLLFAQENYNAIVLEDTETFTMTSATSGSLTVRRSVRVFQDAGLEDAVFQEYTDQFCSIASFKGTVVKDGGKPVRIKKEDLVTVSIASGLAEDGFVNGYRPTASYPFTVTYEYTLSYRKGLASFPAFFPVSGEKVKVEKASYTLQVPAGTRIETYAEKAGEVRKETGKTDSYQWEFPVFEGYTEESLMPSWREMVPFVMACPVDFSYAGVSGSQGTWSDVGTFCHELQKGTETLPDDAVARLKEMTASAHSDLEKIRILYDSLRNRTRYVSIQLGIGGYKPFPASLVHQSGFGDCKGLSNYMQSMLRAVGIPSFYTIVNTYRDRFLPGYSGIGQMNHAMLCVPLPEMKDTLWLECTNPTLPLGYRHKDVAGHDVVLVTERGGIPVRVGAYADSSSRVFTEMDIDLFADGSAKASIRKSLFLDKTESWIGIREWKPETLRSRLTAGLAVQPQSVTLTGVRDNFRDYDGVDYCPSMQVDYSFDTRQYATSGKDRLFVPVNPFPMNAALQRTKRQNDLVFKQGSISRDNIHFHIPEGYKVESLPAPVSLDTEWGSLTVDVKQEDGKVTVLQEFRVRPFRESPDSYERFRSFIRSVNKAYTAHLVLVKE